MVKLVIAGPLAAGFATDLWTCDGDMLLIRERFSAEYNVGHVGQLLHMLGFSPQMLPGNRAVASQRLTPES